MTARVAGKFFPPGCGPLAHRKANVDAPRPLRHLRAMSIAATVENGTIKLPPDIHLPDGTRVEILLPAEEALDDDPKWMLKFSGALDGLPEDFADEHDHYIHGTPKRAGR